MAVNAPIYAHPGDELTSLATVSITNGTIDSNYPVANLVGGNPALPAKATTTALTILYDFGSAKSIEVVGLIHTNLDAGLDVRFQGNATNSWGSPSVDASLTIPAHDGDGFVEGAYADLTGGAHSFRYWQLVVPANSVNVILGQFVLYATLRRAQYFLGTGSSSNTRQSQRSVVSHSTAYGVTMTYDLGIKRRAKNGMLGTKSLATVNAWFDATRGGARPFLFVPDPDVGAATWLARWNQPALTPQRMSPGYWNVPVSIMEVSRGIPWLTGS